MLALKRVYDQADPADGVRFLVERLWPRGVRKTDLRIDAWLKDVAPSDALRRWFSHDPKKWTRLQQRHFAELDSHPQVLEPIRSAARQGRAAARQISGLPFRFLLEPRPVHNLDMTVLQLQQPLCAESSQIPRDHFPHSSQA